MKIITAIDNYNQTHRDVLYLESLDDLNEFAELSRLENDEEINLALKTDVDVSRWDHLFPATLGGMATSILLSKFNQINPILNSGVILEEKFNTLREYIECGAAVIVNRCGGYFPFF